MPDIFKCFIYMQNPIISIITLKKIRHLETYKSRPHFQNEYVSDPILILFYISVDLLSGFLIKMLYEFFTSPMHVTQVVRFSSLDLIILILLKNRNYNYYHHRHHYSISHVLHLCRFLNISGKTTVCFQDAQYYC